jgi:hypothetical protein
VYSDDRNGRALGALLHWVREVLTLVLGITQLIFGAIALYTLYYAFNTGNLSPFSHALPVAVFVVFLRILIAPDV